MNVAIFREMSSGQTRKAPGNGRREIQWRREENVLAEIILHKPSPRIPGPFFVQNFDWSFEWKLVIRSQEPVSKCVRQDKGRELCCQALKRSARPSFVSSAEPPDTFPLQPAAFQRRFQDFLSSDPRASARDLFRSRVYPLESLFFRLFQNRTRKRIPVSSPSGRDWRFYFLLSSLESSGLGSSAHSLMVSTLRRLIYIKSEERTPVTSDSGSTSSRQLNLSYRIHHRRAAEPISVLALRRVFHTLSPCLLRAGWA